MGSAKIFHSAVRMDGYGCYSVSQRSRKWPLIIDRAELRSDRTCHAARHPRYRCLTLRCTAWERFAPTA